MSGSGDVQSDEDCYTVPLQDQRVFGAGIKRKRIAFVPATVPLAQDLPLVTQQKGKSAAQKYLDIIDSASGARQGESSRTGRVIEDNSDQASTYQADVQHVDSQASIDSEQTSETICSVCSLPLSLKTTPGQKHTHHEALLAHQVSLPHQHPPSALDRRRMGLRYLTTHGWDPDSRQGLGKDGEGRQYPIKVNEKRDTVGLGVLLPRGGKVEKIVQKKKLDAKQARLLAAQDGKKRDKLNRQLWGREEELERLMYGDSGSSGLK